MFVPFPPEFQKTLDAISTFVTEKLYPLEEDLLQYGFVKSSEQLEALRNEVRAKGWWAPQVKKTLGGMGLSLVEHGMVSEAVGRSPAGHYVFGCQAPDAGNIEILEGYGTAEQKERWLQPLIDGKIRSCFGMTEPETAGSNPILLESTAVLEDDEWVINGHKWFASSADGSDFCIVMAVTNPDSDSLYGRASMIIVPTDTPGYELVRNIPVMGDEGDGYASHGELRFTDCRVPAANLLGGRGVGFVLAQDRLGPGRIHHCMRWIGIAERAFDLMCRHAVSREIAPGRPLGTRQTVQNWIAESRAEIDAARLLVLDTALGIDEKGTYAARNEISLIKFSVAGMLQHVLDRAIQVHGGLGVTDYTPLSWFFRHERAARIYDGPDEVHKYVVARRILQKYGMKKPKRG